MGATSFDSIHNGALAEEFQHAMAKVARNFMDPNADPEKARKIKIELTFKPTGSGAIETDYTVVPVLAGFAKKKTTFLIGQDAKTGRISMMEYGSAGKPLQVAGEPPMVRTEVIPPQPVHAFDPDTGEIFDPINLGQHGPIDLRAAN